MRVVFVLFDTLIRKSLDVYGGEVGTPNFERLATKSVLFDFHYTGSLPCMPARHDLHTERMNFLHLPSNPKQKYPLAHDNNMVEYFKKEITNIMIQLEAPPESFVRFGMMQYRNKEHKQ